MCAIKDRWKAREGFNDLGILEVLSLTGELEAADTRDKLYGLLGLAREASFRPNYALSMRDVIIDFGLKCPKTVPELRSLSYARRLLGLSLRLPS